MGLGSGIRDPGSGQNLFWIPDPGSRGQKGTGSRIRNTSFGSNRKFCLFVSRTPYLGNNWPGVGGVGGRGRGCVKSRKVTTKKDDQRKYAKPLLADSAFILIYTRDYSQILKTS
jgi:hypothetical protein